MSIKNKGRRSSLSSQIGMPGSLLRLFKIYLWFTLIEIIRKAIFLNNPAEIFPTIHTVKDILLSNFNKDYNYGQSYHFK